MAATNKAAQLRLEFKEKNRILDAYGTWVSAYDFYDIVFHDALPDDRVMLVEAGQRYRAMSRENAIEFALGRSDVYMSTVHFYQDYKVDDFIDWVYAFVIDLDGITPAFLKRILENIVDGDGAPVPNLVCNSGSGVHFLYVLSHPIYCWPTTRKMARELYSALAEMFDNYNGLDRHSIGHSYRLVGSMTKLGDIATGYVLSDALWSVKDLSDEVGYDWFLGEPEDPRVELQKAQAYRNGEKKRDAEERPATDRMKRFAAKLSEWNHLPEPDYSDYDATHKFIEEHYHAPNKKGFGFADADKEEWNVSGSKVRVNEAWYISVRDDILRETKPGNRYKSLMALSCIAFKCNIPYDRLERDVKHIANVWCVNPEWSRDPFNKKNVDAALRCYSSRFVRVRRETLLEWLGWDSTKWNRPEKAHRPQQEFLADSALQRSYRSLYKIRDFMKKCPDISNLTKTEIAKKTGLSRKTVYKYYDIALASLKK